MLMGLVSTVLLGVMAYYMTPLNLFKSVLCSVTYMGTILALIILKYNLPNTRPNILDFYANLILVIIMLLVIEILALGTAVDLENYYERSVIGKQYEAEYPAYVEAQLVTLDVYGLSVSDNINIDKYSYTDLITIDKTVVFAKELAMSLEKFVLSGESLKDISDRHDLLESKGIMFD
jgi:hypothetical protein